ncbi:AraC family transcriptional regulator [Halomonas sp. R1t4]|nr:AraC family transcriptional regulator [Halomonas sp. R1t4]MCP1330268.1 AraC family transcriptional regulator [Halomonas sp. R1t4]
MVRLINAPWCRKSPIERTPSVHTVTMASMRQQPRIASPNITSHWLAQLGQRFGIHYHFESSDMPRQPVATGHVHDVRLPQGMHLTLSGLDVKRGYTSTSYQSVPWFLSVILEGTVHLQLGKQQRLLQAGEGVCTHFDARHPLTVHHPVQTRLRTVNIAVLTTAPLGLPTPPDASCLHCWKLPKALCETLCTISEQPPSLWRQALVWQGLALQLIGLGLPERLTALSEHKRLSTRDRHCLTALHSRIAQHPAEPYSLTALAKEAAMSPSSLRQKFRACYGCTLFDYIRQVRLQQGYEALQRGASVQQAAHHCGYRHASNFSSAFKRHFGFSPHEWKRSSV